MGHVGSAPKICRLAIHHETHWSRKWIVWNFQILIVSAVNVYRLLQLLRDFLLRTPYLPRLCNCTHWGGLCPQNLWAKDPKWKLLVHLLLVSHFNTETRSSFSQRPTTHECIFLVTLVYLIFCSCDPDLDTHTWPRYCQRVHAYQKLSFQVTGFISWSMNRTFNWLMLNPFNASCSKLLLFKRFSAFEV